MKKESRKLKFAIKQLINATWVIKYEIPDDDINKTRALVGAEPEILVREHIRDDKYYGKTNIHYYIEEDKDRLAIALVLELMPARSSPSQNPVRTRRHPIRNKKHVFDYSYGGPVDQILEKNRRFLEG